MKSLSWHTRGGRRHFSSQKRGGRTVREERKGEYSSRKKREGKDQRPILSGIGKRSTLSQKKEGRELLSTEKRGRDGEESNDIRRLIGESSFCSAKGEERAR